MDYNVTVLGGRLAARPETSGDATRMLVEVASQMPRRRHDLVPVIHHYFETLRPSLDTGDLVWVVGQLQRRFSTRTGHGRLEVVASYVAPQSAN